MRVILYTSITGGYDLLPNVEPENGIEYWLFSDRSEMQTPPFWKKFKLESPFELAPRRLSRLPKLRPHFYLPPHDVSIYMDANLELRRPICDFALACVRELPIAVHPHPKTTCLYAEGKKCIELKLDDENAINAHLARYQQENFPTNYGLAENSFIIRQNTEEIGWLNDLWHLEYFSGSQRDQLSLMYCLWRKNVQVHWIRQNPRDNSYFSRREHMVCDRPRQKGKHKKRS